GSAPRRPPDPTAALHSAAGSHTRRTAAKPDSGRADPRVPRSRAKATRRARPPPHEPRRSANRDALPSPPSPSVPSPNPPSLPLSACRDHRLSAALRSIARRVFATAPSGTDPNRSLITTALHAQMTLFARCFLLVFCQLGVGGLLSLAIPPFHDLER